MGPLGHGPMGPGPWAQGPGAAGTRDPGPWAAAPGPWTHGPGPMGPWGPWAHGTPWALGPMAQRAHFTFYSQFIHIFQKCDFALFSHFAYCSWEALVQWHATSNE